MDNFQNIISDLYKIYEPHSFHKALEKCQQEGGNIPLGRFQMPTLSLVENKALLLA